MRKVPWGVVAPVSLFAIALGSLAWFDVTTGGKAQPVPSLGELGTPVRYAYVASPPTPQAAATPTPRPTLPASSVQGTVAERDARRKLDLALLVAAAEAAKADRGSYPTTGGQVQSLCVYEKLDKGCLFKQYINVDLPKDPLGNFNGYWYSSDGETARFYAWLEGGSTDDALCHTGDPGSAQHANMICATAH